jgi:hypothetical protein
LGLLHLKVNFDSVFWFKCLCWVWNYALMTRVTCTKLECWFGSFCWVWCLLLTFMSYLKVTLKEYIYKILNLEPSLSIMWLWYFMVCLLWIEGLQFQV